MNDLRDELKQMKMDLDVIQKVECSDSEQKEYLDMVKNGHSLPEDIIRDEDVFYRCVKNDLSKDELAEFLMYRQIRYLKNIQKTNNAILRHQEKYLVRISDCMIFFVVMTLLSIITCIIISILSINM